MLLTNTRTALSRSSRTAFSWRALRHAVRDGVPSLIGALPLVLALAGGGAPAAAQKPPRPPLPRPIDVPQPFPSLTLNQLADVTTYHNDNGRTGQNLREVRLTPDFVKNGFKILTDGRTRVAANDPRPGTVFRFGKMYSRQVDDAIYGQPLFVSNLRFLDPRSGFFTQRDVVIVCTANNTVYAFDAGASITQPANPKLPLGTVSDYNTTPPGPIWQYSFNYPAIAIGPVPATDIVGEGIQPYGTPTRFGIMGTPVIDLQVDPVTGARSGTLYLVVRTKEQSDYFYRLWALDLATGTPLPNSPVLISGSNLVDNTPGSPNFGELLGKGINTRNPNNFVNTFDSRVPLYPMTADQRCGLLLAQPAGALGGRKVIYVAWGGTENADPFGGFVAGFDAETLERVATFSASEEGNRAGVTMGGSGLVGDESGNLFFATGNGFFDAMLPDSEKRNFGNSILKIAPDANFVNGTPPSPLSYFTPYNQAELNALSLDLGTGGVMALPTPASNPNGAGLSPAPDARGPNGERLLIGAGMEGKVYLLNRDTNLGGHNTTPGDESDSNAVQFIPGAVGASYGPPAYYYDGRTHRVYYVGVGDTMKAFTFANGRLNRMPTQYNPNSRTFDFTGAVPSISANATTNPDTTRGASGIVWAVEPYFPPPPSPFSPQPPPTAVLHAYAASDVTQRLYTSQDAGARDSGPRALPYAVPTVANGKVYVAGDRELIVYGMVPPKQATAERFLVAGPSIDDWFILFGVPLFIESNVGYHWSITAIGPDNAPIKLGSATSPASVQIGIRSPGFGPIRFIGSELFRGESNVVMNRYLLNPGYFEWYMTDEAEKGNKVDPITTFYPLTPQSFSVDHFVVRAPSSVRFGQKFFMTIQAVTVNGSPVPYSGLVFVNCTNPNGTQKYALGPLNNDLSFRDDCAYEDQYGYLWLLTGGLLGPPPVVFSGQTQVTVPIADPNITYAIRRKGDGTPERRVFIATDFVATGTAAITFR